MRVTIKKGHNWLLFKQPEVNDHSVKDQMDKWRQLRQKIVTTAFSGRPSTVFVRLPQHENISQVLKMPGRLTTLDKTHYELYTCKDSFDDNQLKDITDSVGFELSSLWIGGQDQGAEAAGKDDSQVRESIEAAEKCEMEDDVPETRQEVCVCVADGSVLCWLNPPDGRRAPVLDAVQSLVTSWGWSLHDAAGSSRS
nr:hypothetical protein BaRGS_033143 [Batillaria attramentaria]